MTKKNRKRSKHNYSKYTHTWNDVEINDTNEKYYGLHRDGKRVKIDVKRMKKLDVLDIPCSVLNSASSIPRNTVYFLPRKVHRQDYIVNQFRDKLIELKDNWHEFETAFSHIPSPETVADNIRTEQLLMGYCEIEEASILGIIAGAKRSIVYQKLWISQCAQFIHQMATELDALMLRKCVYLGYSRKDVTRGSMHDYLNGSMRGKAKIEDLAGYETYTKFFTIWNMLKHNSEDLFNKIQKNYPDMLLTNTYRNGEMSQYYLKIGKDYIERMLDSLLEFYESLCSVFFEEDVNQAEWNYDDYFIEKVKIAIDKETNPLGI